MFRSLKFYIGQEIDPYEVVRVLSHFCYRRVRKVWIEGDFAKRGEIIDVFPLNFDSPVRIALDDNQIRFLSSYNIKSGQPIWQHKILIILPWKKHLGHSLPSPFRAETPLNYAVDIQRNDFVVHNQHGIGRFLGIETLATHTTEKKKHLVIEYQGGEKLFVPEHNLHLVQKYIGFHKRPPRLHKLGSREWKRVRTQIQKRIQRLAGELLHLHAVRTSMQGHGFAPDTDLQQLFEKGFPFEETPDQLQAMADVKRDMESPFPMDRLLCGDVGFGKTEIALRAAFKAVADDSQVAVLVPTTILAEQHFYNFSNRLKKFPVTVDMLSRFRPPSVQKRIITDMAKGNIDIIIGTHRLFSKDIHFKNLGLIIIDEEQRFGVRAKERLKHLRLLADVLTLTATPIPRTLYMSLTGAKDMSVISTPPKNRIPVATHIVAFNEDLIKEAVTRELRRRGQVFFLHNRVEDITHIGSIIQQLVPSANIAVAHGQLPAQQLERIMLQFLKGDVDVLVCTTIIQSGIDIPNANTLIINRADRFGLAELHQLRGRVGRFTNQAYAYLLVPPDPVVSSLAKSRLQALEKYSELGAGFQIAFEDLQIRGAGNLLGNQQSGYINTVGFDLYCRLLREAVEHLKSAYPAGVKPTIKSRETQAEICNPLT